jgi:NADH-quinone oxidoreductase subunit J
MLDLAQSLPLSATTASSAGPLPAVLFYGFAGLVLGGAFAVALARNIVRQAIGLLFALAGMSGFYLLLQAEFLAAVQLVVYVGGTLILVIFGVMLTAKNPNIRYDPAKREVLWALLVGLVLAGGLIGLFVRGVPGMQGVSPQSWIAGPTAAEQANVNTGAAYSVKSIGHTLLDPEGYLAPFELISVLLLAVMIGAAYLAKARKHTGQSAAADPGPRQSSV